MAAECAICLRDMRGIATCPLGKTLEGIVPPDEYPRTGCAYQSVAVASEYGNHIVAGKSHTLTVQAITLLEKRFFDSTRPDNCHVHNAWHTSSVRDYLNSAFLNGFSAGDQATIQTTGRRTYSWVNEEYIHTNDSVFLLSASEAGFQTSDCVADEGVSYDYYKAGNIMRMLTDNDGDRCKWWVRSSHYMYDCFVCYTDTFGALNYDFANLNLGVPAVCVIG